ncbi:hypothetical protein SS50377_22630 [Spironucleus salmonicida]|uniref:Uncharacterized protein n=1 Tax=Spironucleus salmonicida TaxID=348837 RepID=A0A9P8LVI0_9EUKA|nr:hypothetical protein SS50377_22630 [Spironucleus salmonicida]
MKKNSAIDYAFNQESKFIANIQKIHQIDTSKFTCDYPLVLFPIQEIQIEKQAIRNKLENVKIQRLKTQQIHQFLQQNQCEPLSDKELISVEKAAHKLTQNRLLNSHSSLKRNTSYSSIVRSQNARKNSYDNLQDLKIFGRQ